MSMTLNGKKLEFSLRVEVDCCWNDLSEEAPIKIASSMRSYSYEGDEREIVFTNAKDAKAAYDWIEELYGQPRTKLTEDELD